METLKKHLTIGLAHMPQIEVLENNQLILVTAAGIISGSYTPSASESPNSSDVIVTTIDKLSEAYMEQHNIPNNALLDGNDGYITLTNVTIRNGQGTVNTPFLCVFFDQIIGISLGNLN